MIDLHSHILPGLDDGAQSLQDSLDMARMAVDSGITADEFAQAKLDGWEKQYPYKVGRKKVYMAPSVAEAQGLVRASKHPKNKIGRAHV